MVDPAHIIQELNRAGVDYVVIGGMAATLHGCPEQTYDLDILYADNDPNRARLLAALEAIKAEWDEPLTAQVLRRQSVFALNTLHGDLDIFTQVPGLGGFDQALHDAQSVELDGCPVRILNLAALITTKAEAADPNPRKQAALAFLKRLYLTRTT